VIDWIAALAEVSADGRPAVLVTLLTADGSTPRDAGAKMVVTADQAKGTIGGGRLELEVLAEARALLARAAEGEAPAGPQVKEMALGPSLGQCCGGRTSVLLEPVLPAPWQVAVFGAGHVGKALVRLLAGLPCGVFWIDSRAEELPAEPPPGVRRVLTDDPAAEVDDLPRGADLVVMTHSHALDQEIVDAALRRGAHRFLGLIGSKTKRAKILARLAEQGRTPEQLAQVTCPIGLSGILGKEPAVIAISVAAQLLLSRGAAAEPGPRQDPSSADRA
jgi:xanthine dehydrogenase accessory factor